MIPRSSVRPLELVISAIHCLKERRGSSPQDIVKYLLGKYHVNPNSLKTDVQTGLKRGLSFGLITQRAGLYRLNDILSSPVNVPVSLKNLPKTKSSKTERTFKKQKLKKTTSKKGKRNIYQHMIGSLAQRGKRKTQRSREKKKSVRKRLLGIRTKNALRRRKQKRQKPKVEKTQKPKLEKTNKIKPEKVSEIKVPNAEHPESRCGSANSKEPENVKNNVKT